MFESIPYHCGSVTYTYKTSDVKIGKPVTNTITATATLDQASNWFSTKEGVYGTDMDNDGICSDRDFIKEYSSFIGLSKLNNTPAYYTNKNNPIPAGYTRIQNWTGADGFIPKIGDIAIWKDGPFGSEGHFGIVLAADGWNITKFLEIKTNGLQGKVAITTGSNDYSYFWGVLRPVFANKITKRAVFFKNIDGTLLKFQLVPNGSNATPPANPTYPNHTFTGWYDRNADVRDYTNVTKDITLIAQYRLNTSTQTVTKPSAITTLKATLYGYDDIKLTWNKTSDTTKYAIYYKKNSEASYKYWKSVTTTYVNAPNLADGVKYTFKVVPCRVYNSKNYYGTSKTVSKYTLKRVSTPTVTKYSSTKVKLTWGKITGSSGYQISRTTTLTGTSVVKTVSSSCVSTTLSTTRNKTYYYKVRSYATVGTKKIYGPWSYIKGYKLK